MQVAIFVDGSFFLKRYVRVFPGGRSHDPRRVARNMFGMLLRHLDRRNGDDLYRIFYYDCPPFMKKAHNPITKRSVDFSKSDQAMFRLQFYEELKKLRKLALRLGTLQDGHGWEIRSRKVKDLLSGKLTLDDLTEGDVFYDLRQKGVDMRIGLDIASVAFKKQAQKMVLVAGDTDFVPAAKLARREGIDFVLDPMWNPINPSLFEHIDGLKSTCQNPNRPPHSAPAADPESAPMEDEAAGADFDAEPSS